jgi:hypothetical protein
MPATTVSEWRVPVTRTLIALTLLATGAAAAAEPAKFGREHLSPTLGCAVVGYRYTGAAKLASLGNTKDDIATALLSYRNPGETDQEVQLAAEQATAYASAHSLAESEQIAEEKFTACLKEKHLPVDLEAAPKCWRDARRIDDVIEQRQEGTSKETMLERAAAVEAQDAANGKALSEIVEQVYGWNRNPAELSIGLLIGCVKAR